MVGCRNRPGSSEFDPSHDDLGETLKKIEKRCQSTLAGPVRLSVLAPFFFLVNQRASLDRFSHSSALRTLTLFSNNYTLQGVKIKASKPVLNRVCHYLSRLEPETVGNLSISGETRRHLRYGFVIHSGKVLLGWAASIENFERGAEKVVDDNRGI